MAQIKKCILKYTTGVLQYPVHFEEGQEKCQNCPYIQHREALKRSECYITGEYIMNPFEGIQDGCPIVFNVNENGELK